MAMGDGADMCHDMMDQEIMENAGNWEWEDERQRQAEAFDRNWLERDKNRKMNNLRDELPF